MATKTGKKDYAAIAREKMYRPAEGPRKPYTFLFYSRNKKGKTTLTSTAGDILIADPEYGADKMLDINPHLWPIEKWEDVDDFYKYVRSNPTCVVCPDKHKFKWVALDGLTRINSMALNYVMKVQEEKDLDRQPGMVAQRDYGKSGNLMKQMLSNFHSLPLGKIYTCQERQDSPFQGDDDDEDASDLTASFVPDLPKGVRSEVNAIVDVIGRLYVVKVEGTDGVEVMQRRLWVGPSMQYDTGYRSDYELPPVVKNPTVPKLVKLVREGQKKKKAS